MFIIIVCIMVVVDRISKIWAIENLKNSNSWNVLGDFFQLSYVENTGAAFGMLKNARWFFLVFTILILLGILYYYLTHRKEFDRVKVLLLAFFIGGTIGNLIDRWAWGYVVDFLSVNIGTYSFPVFNIADIGITLSVLSFILLMLKEDQEDKHV